VIVSFPHPPNLVNKSNISISSISGPEWGYITPSVSSVSPFEKSNTFIVKLSLPLTFSAIYSVGVSGITYKNGAPFSQFSQNFSSNYYDPSIALYACFSTRRHVDVVFDRDVSPTYFAEASINSDSGSHPISFNPWDSSIPSNVIRFSFSNIPVSNDGVYSIKFSGVLDSSMNLCDGSVNVIHNLKPPFDFSGVSQLHVTSSYVIGDRVGYKDETLIRVFFSSPVDKLTNVNNFQVKETSSHFKVDPSDEIQTPIPSDSSSFISFISSSLSKFNTHVNNTWSHNIQDNSYRVYDSIVLAEDIKKNIVLHSKSPYHGNGSPSISVISPSPFDEPSLIVLVNELRSKFISHFTSGIHTSTLSSDWNSFSSVATDITSCRILLDQMKTRLQIHDSSDFHASPTGFIPKSPYVSRTVTHTPVVSQITSSFVLREIINKFSDHLRDDIHIHRDIPNETGELLIRPDVISSLISSSQIFMDKYNSHIDDEYSPEITSVSYNFSSINPEPPQPDPNQYFSDILVKSNPKGNSYKVLCSVNGEDGQTSTNTLDYTGKNESNSYGINDVFNGFSYPDGSAIISKVRNIGHVLYPTLKSNGINIPIKEFRKTHSMYMMCDRISDLIKYFNSHITESGHRDGSSLTIFPDENFSYSFRWAFSSLNSIISILNSHISNNSIHYSPQTEFLNVDPIGDIESADRALELVEEKIRSHDSNLGLHSHSSNFKTFGFGPNSIVIKTNGWKDLQNVSVNIGDENIGFVGRSNPISLISVIHSPSSNSSEVRGDYIDFVLSKSCSSPLSPSNLEFLSGSASVKSFRQLSSNVLRACVVGLRETNYTVDINSIKDNSGNFIVSGSSIGHVSSSDILRVTPSITQNASSLELYLKEKKGFGLDLNFSGFISFVVTRRYGVGIRYHSDVDSNLILYDNSLRPIFNADSNQSPSYSFFSLSPGTYYLEAGSDSNSKLTFLVFLTSSDVISFPSISRSYIGPGDFSIDNNRKYASFLSSVIPNSQVNIDMTPDSPMTLNVRVGSKNGSIVHQMVCVSGQSNVSNFQSNGSTYYFEVFTNSEFSSGEFSLALS
jgi:hypothetical protein